MLSLLPEDLSLAPSTHTRNITATCNSSSDSFRPSWTLEYKQYTHIYKIFQYWQLWQRATARLLSDSLMLQAWGRWLGEQSSLACEAVLCRNQNGWLVKLCVLPSTAESEASAATSGAYNWLVSVTATDTWSYGTGKSTAARNVSAIAQS